MKIKLGVISRQAKRSIHPDHCHTNNTLAPQSSKRFAKTFVILKLTSHVLSLFSVVEFELNYDDKIG